MNTIQTVKSNKKFRAIQFTKNNIEEIQEFVTPNYEVFVISETHIRIDSLFNESYFGVDLGNWIVKDEDRGQFVVCTDYVYLHNYEEISHIETEE